MLEPQLQHEILEELRVLPVEKQRQVLQFARAISTQPPGGSVGGDLLKFAGAVSAADCDEMEKAIENGCERIDFDAW